MCAVATHAVRLTADNAGELVARLRHRRRRLGQFRDPLRRLRRMLPCPQAAGDRGGRPVRRLDHDAQALSRRVPDGMPNPTYRCLFPEAPPDGLLPTCAQAGILGALTGVIGSLQALEVIKEIVGIGNGLVGRLLLYDARATRFETIEYRWSPSNPLTGIAPQRRRRIGAGSPEQASARGRARPCRPSRRRSRKGPSGRSDAPLRRRQHGLSVLR